MSALVLSYPPPLNRLYRSWRGRVVMTDEGKRWKLLASAQADKNWPMKTSGPVAVTIHAYRPAKRGDIDGPLKLTLDACEGGRYFNDRQIVELHVYRHDDKDNPRIEIDIHAPSGAQWHEETKAPATVVTPIAANDNAEAQPASASTDSSNEWRSCYTSAQRPSLGSSLPLTRKRNAR